MTTAKQELKEIDELFKRMQLAFKKLREKVLLNEYGAKSNFCIGVRAGHGGYSNGTYVTAPQKMFYHKGAKMHKSGYFYEGVFNRILADKFCNLLKENKMIYKRFYHEYEDWPLKRCSDLVNYHHVNVKPVLLFELHSNASRDQKARGFSVYTSPKQTQSDLLATKLWHEMDKIKDKFGFSMRADKWKDGDVDYEAKFWMCTKTACPSILPEFLFFDNLQDANILMLPSFQNACAEALLNTAIWGNKNIVL